MNEREKGICSRVKLLRERLNWSQPDFAALLGISLNQLASIEYGRTPLRYDIAWKIRVLLDISLEWLSVGEFYADSVFNDDLPPPNRTGLPNSALLSEVSDKVHGVAAIAANYRKHRSKHKIDDQELRHRAFIYLSLRNNLEQWITEIPDGYTSDFADKIHQLGNKYIKALRQDPDELVAAREDALMWEKLRLSASSKLIHAKMGQKDNLTKTATSPNLVDVTDQWPVLKRKLQEATSVPGTKSKLAKFLGVDLTRISQWLSDSKNAREPGAEYALRMLYWVEHPEVQK